MIFNELPEQIKLHMESLIASSELPDTADFKTLLADTWNRKCSLFEQQAKILEMELVNTMDENDPRGVIVLTYSGSIVSINPKEETREVEYASIHLRSDVPKTVSILATNIVSSVEIGKAVEFSSGQLKTDIRP